MDFISSVSQILLGLGELDSLKAAVFNKTRTFFGFEVLFIIKAIIFL